MIIKKCVDCGKQLKDLRSTRCGSCSKKGKNHHFWGKHFTIEHKQNQSRGHTKTLFNKDYQYAYYKYLMEEICQF